MVEQQIEIEVLIPDFKVDLAAEEGESCTEFEEKVLDVIDQDSLHLALSPFVGVAQEIKEIGIFESLLRHV